MTENHELESLREDVRRLQRQQRRRAWWIALCIVPVGIFGGVLPVAFSAPQAPTPCSHGDLYCFGAGAPARAAEVNSNFETLHGVTDNLATAITAANTNANGRLSQSGGTITGSLTVNGNLSVGGGLPIGVTGEWQARSEGTALSNSVNMTSTNRSVCFLTGAGMKTADFMPRCQIVQNAGVWRLDAQSWANQSNITECRARCITW